jgi:hypothetical protein
MTNYTLSVAMVHRDVTQAHYSFAYNFTTRTPPFGGSLQLDPPQEKMEGNYVLMFKNWSSMLPPMAFRVSSTLDNVKVGDLSTGWVSFNQSNGKV